MSSDKDFLKSLENISNDKLKMLIKIILDKVFKSDQEKSIILKEILTEYESNQEPFDLEAVLGTTNYSTTEISVEKAKNDLKILETMAKDALNIKDGAKALKIYEAALKISEKFQFDKISKKYREFVEKLPVQYRIEKLQEALKRIKENDANGQSQKNIQESQLIIKLIQELQELNFDLQKTEYYQAFLQAIYDVIIWYIESIMAESRFEQRKAYISQLFEFIVINQHICVELFKIQIINPTRVANLEMSGMIFETALERYGIEFHITGDIEGNKCQVVCQDLIGGKIDSGMSMRTRIYNALLYNGKTAGVKLNFNPAYLKKEVKMPYMADHYYIDDLFLWFQRCVLNKQFEAIMKKWETLKMLFPEPPFSISEVKISESNQTLSIYHLNVKSGITFELREQNSTATLNIQQKVSFRDQNSEFNTNCVAFFLAIKPDIKNI